MRDPLQPAIQLFKRLHGTVPTRTLQAPACVPWLGAATLAHGGLLLASRTPLGAVVACAPRSDAWIELATSEQDRVKIRPHALDGAVPSPGLAAAWLLLRQLRLERVHFGGFNLVCSHDVPGPLSRCSAPAMAVATLLAIRELYPFSVGESGPTAPPRRDERGRLPPPGGLERARLAHLAARGLEPHSLPLVLAVMEAKAWDVVSVDAHFGAVESLPLPGYVAVLSTGAAVEPDPAARDRERNLEHWGAEAARKLGVPSLRTVELRDLTAARPRLTPVEYASGRLIVEEIARTVAAERALRGGDPAQFGQYLLDSLSNQAKPVGRADPLSALTGQARLFPGCLGSVRLPGAAAHLISHHLVPRFVEALSRLDPGLTHQTLAAG